MSGPTSGTAGGGKPAGRLDHACFGSGDKLQVFDIWESQQDFGRFGETLMPILQQLASIPASPWSSRSTTSFRADSQRTKFGETLLPMSKLGADPGEPQVATVHKMQNGEPG